MARCCGSCSGGLNFFFGAGGILSTARTFIYPGNIANANNTTGELVAGGFFAPADGTLRNFVVGHANPFGATNLTYIPRINQVDDPNVAILLASSSGGPATDLANTIPVNAGDLITVAVDNSALATVPVRALFQFEFVPD